MQVITSPETMVSVIREYGIIPFFNSHIDGWSVEELTAPGYWFDGETGELGPWDWKIEAVREGDIAYGKFLGGKAAFATAEWYEHLMNWRRSQSRYRMALGERFAAKNHSDKLMSFLAPVALSAIKDAGALGARELRSILSEAVTPKLVKSMGASYEKLLVPSVRKNVVDSVLQFLQMGTWSVIGDFERVYRGPNLEYRGWQRASNTTPDELFSFGEASAGEPFWAALFEDEMDKRQGVTCSPEESRDILISHIRGFFPEADEKTLVKLF